MLKTTHEMKPLEVLLEIIIHKYLHSYCLTIISDNLECTNLPQHMTNIRLPNPNLDSILKASEMNCSDYLIQSKDPERFLEIYTKVNQISNIRRGDRKLIFIPTNIEENSVVLKILQRKEVARIPNLLLLIPQEKETKSHCETYELITHQFIGPGPDWSQPKLLDRWDSCTGFERGVNVFPHDMRNMYGRPVKVACFNFKPFVLLDLDPTATPYGRDGVDFRALEQVCKLINCSIDLVDVGAQAWGAVYDNGTGGGVLGTTAAGLADLGTTSLGAWYSAYRHMDFSSYSMSAAVTAIVPSPVLVSVWELPLLAFSWWTWALVLASIALTSLAIVLARRRRGSTMKVVFEISAIMLAQPQKSLSWQRRIVGWLILMGLVINAAYCAGLAYRYTVAMYSKSIDTIQDLIDSGMEWGAAHPAWIYSIASSKKEETKKLLSQFRVYPPEVLIQKSLNRSMALSIEVLTAGYTAGDYLTAPAVSAYQLLKEDFYFEYGVVMAPKNSPLIARVTDVLGLLHQSGLVLAFNTQVFLKHSDYKVQLAIRYSRIRDKLAVEPLSYHHIVVSTRVKGVFMIYAAGGVTSIAVFLLEVLARRIYKNNDQ